LKIATSTFPEIDMRYVAIKRAWSTLFYIFPCVSVAILSLPLEQSIRRTRKQRVLYGNYTGRQIIQHTTMSPR